MKWRGSLSAALLLGCSAMHAQFSRTGPEWTTAGMDAQRSRSVSADPQITLESMKRPGFTFLWKSRLGAPGSYSEPVLVNTFIAYRGFKALAVVGAGDSLYAVDYDLGTPYWEKHLAPSGKGKACPAAAAVAPGRLTPLVPPPVTGTGSRGGYHSTVGRPGEGVPLKEVARVPSAAPTVPPPAPASTQAAAPANAPAPNGPGIGGASGPGGAPADAAPLTGPVRTGPPPGTGLYKGSQPIFAVSADGVLHAISQGSAKEITKPAPFVPPGTGLFDLIDVGDTVYAASVPGCGEGSDSVFAMDVSASPAERTASSWRSPAGHILGPPAFTAGGTVVVATQRSLTLLEAKTLKPRRTISRQDAALVSPPVVFTFGGKETVAVADAAGHILLYFADGSGTPVVAPSAGRGFAAARLATWQDADGGRWLAVAEEGQREGRLQVYRVANQAGGPSLQLVWERRSPSMPGAPMVIGEVLFSLERGDRSRPATVRAFQAETGAELWNSGPAIGSYVDRSDLSFSPGQIYVAAHDGLLYAFGFPVPRQ